MVACASPNDLFPLAKSQPSYRVIYSANGGDGAAPVDSQRYVRGAHVTVPDATSGLANSGNIFSGWNTLANGSGSSYAVGDVFSFNANSDVTLFAVWLLGTSVTIAGGAISQGSTLPSGQLIIPPGVTSIAPNGFLDCTGITSVTIPPGVTDIGNSAFYGCTSLISVTIPASVTTIGVQAFQGCDLLSSVTLPAGLTAISSQAFSGCYSLTSMTIPAAVTSIGIAAFDGCYGLTSITIPAAVTSIGLDAFVGCAGLATISVDPSNPNYKSVGGVLFDKAGTTLLKVPAKFSGFYTIPNGVTSIGVNAFVDCDGVTGVSIPASLTSLSGFNSSGLTSLVIPSTVTSILASAFSPCVHLTTVTIPSSVTSIGIQAFDQCPALTDVYVQNSTPPPLGSPLVFANCAPSLKIHVPNPADITTYQSAAWWTTYATIVSP